MPDLCIPSRDVYARAAAAAASLEGLGLHASIAVLSASRSVLSVYRRMLGDRADYYNIFEQVPGVAYDVLLVDGVDELDYGVYLGLGAVRVYTVSEPDACPPGSAAAPVVYRPPPVHNAWTCRGPKLDLYGVMPMVEVGGYLYAPFGDDEAIVEAVREAGELCVTRRAFRVRPAAAIAYRLASIARAGITVLWG